MSRTLWNKYPVFAAEGEYALFDPIGLETVYLSEREMRSLTAASAQPQLKRLLHKLGFTSTNTESRRDMLLRALQDSHINAVPNRVCGYRIVITDKCNMACSYCFVDTNTGLSDMTEDELRAGLEYLFEQNRDCEEVSIQWFGGEPTIRFDLMQFGDELNKRLSAKYGVRRVRTTVVTNGMKLTDSMIQHFAKYRYGVGVSFDAPVGLNAKYRVMLNGLSADDKIKRTIGRLLETNGISVGINVTPTPANYDKMRDLVDYALEYIGVRFIYVNTPIPAHGRWEVPGRRLAQSLVAARRHALKRGAMFYSAADRVYQALDARRYTTYEYLQSDGGVIAALLPGGKVSVCDINWKHDDFLCSLEDLKRNPRELTRICKKVGPVAQCEGCAALAICGGPSANDVALRGTHEPDREFCDFYTTLLELAIWDSTGLQ